MKNSKSARSIGNAHARGPGPKPRPKGRSSEHARLGTRPRPEPRPKRARRSNMSIYAGVMRKARAERTLMAILDSAPCSFGSDALIGLKMTTSAGDVVLFKRVGNGPAADGGASLSVMSVPALEAAIEEGRVELLNDGARA